MIDPQVLAFAGIAAILTITPGADTMLVMRSVIARGRRAGLMTTLGICGGLFIHATLSGLGLSWVLLRSAPLFETVKLLGACYLIFLGSQSLWNVFRKSRDDQFVQPEGEMAAQINQTTQHRYKRINRSGPACQSRARGRRGSQRLFRIVFPLRTFASSSSGLASRSRSVGCLKLGGFDLAGAKTSFVEGMLTNVLNPKVAVFYLAFLPQFINPNDPVLAKSLLLAAIHFVMGLVWLSAVTFLLGKLRAVLTRPVVKATLETITGVVLIGFGLRLATERN